MIKIGNSILLFLFCSFIFLKAQADVSVVSTVDRTEMGVGDTFTVTISVTSTESVDVGEPRIPNLDEFELVNSWNSSSTSTKLIQGPGGMQFESVRRYDFSYMLTPLKAGNISIPAFEVVVDGKVHYTKPILLSVSEEGSGAAQAPQGFPGGTMLDEADEIFNQLLQRRGVPKNPPAHRNLPKNHKEAFFVQVEIDKLEVYEGEQITVSWYIYTRGNILTLDRLKFPDLKGFWKEIIEEVPALNFTQEVVNGVPYRKALLASHALFPIKAGTAVVDEYKIKAQVQLPTNPYGAFGFGPAYSYSRSSDRVPIKVKPLPVEGRPSDFAGAVGQFEIKAAIEGKEFKVNQPLTMRIRFEGSGNAKLIELPNLNLPAGVEMFDSKFDSKFFKNGRSYKEFEVLLIPRQEGMLKIPPMSFSMFDPKTNKYIQKSTSGFELNIEPGDGHSPLLADQPLTGSAVSQVQNTLPPVITSYNSQSSSAVPMLGGGLWMLLYAIVIGGLGLRARWVLAEKAKKRDLRKELNKRIGLAFNFASKNDYRAVGTTMTNSFYIILGEIAGLGGAANEIYKILDMSPPSIRRELGEKIMKLSEKFQILSFAPEEVLGDLKNPQNLKSAISESEKLLLKAIELSDTVEPSS